MAAAAAIGGQRASSSPIVAAYVRFAFPDAIPPPVAAANRSDEQRVWAAITEALAGIVVPGPPLRSRLVSQFPDADRVERLIRDAEAAMAGIGAIDLDVDLDAATSPPVILRCVGRTPERYFGGIMTAMGGVWLPSQLFLCSERTASGECLPSRLRLNFEIASA